MFRLDSTDKAVSSAAQNDIDAYLEQRDRRAKEQQLYGEIVAGCRTTKSKTSINRRESKEEEKLRRRRLADEYKRQGNEWFAKEQYKRAESLYTSAIMQVRT